MVLREIVLSRTVVSFVIACLFSVPLWSQDCGSPSSLLAHYKYANSEVVKQLMFSQYADSRYEDVKDSQGVGLMYEDLDLNFNSNSHRSLKTAIKSSSYVSTFNSKKDDLIWTYGDPALVEAYKACLGSIPTFSLRQTEAGGQGATFEVRYFTGSLDDPRTASISKSFHNDLVRQGAQVLSDTCGGQILPNNKPCHFSVRYPSDIDREIRVIVKSTRGSAPLYIPPRRVFRVKDVGDIPRSYGKGSGTITATTIYPSASTASGCTSELPKNNRFIVVNREGGNATPQVIAGGAPNYPDTKVRNLKLLTPSGLQKTVCFSYECYFDGPGAYGQQRACEGYLNGRVVEIGWFPLNEN